jgi:hypothetical protein
MALHSIYTFLYSNKLLNSNFFTALATFAVGGFALVIYRRQHRDERTSGAKIIYSEISSAEAKLKTIKEQFFAAEHPVLGSVILMPAASWNKYKYIFKQDLFTAEWELIEKFYVSCESYDDAVRLNQSYFHNNTMPTFETFNHYYLDVVKKFIKAKPSDTLFEESETDELSHFQDVFLKNAGHMWYQPVKPINDARAALVALDSTVSLSSGGQKLKRIAKLKD